MKLVGRIYWVVAVTLVACMAVLLAALWDSLPAPIPLSFDAAGQPVRLIGRWTLLAAPLLGAALLASALLLSRRAGKRNPRARAERLRTGAIVLTTHLILVVVIVFLYLLGTARNGRAAAGLPAVAASGLFLLAMAGGFMALYGRLAGKS